VAPRKNDSELSVPSRDLWADCRRLFAGQQLIIDPTPLIHFLLTGEGKLPEFNNFYSSQISTRPDANPSAVKSRALNLVNFKA
jgi:hypothetical protein